MPRSRTTTSVAAGCQRSFIVVLANCVPPAVAASASTTSAQLEAQARTALLTPIRPVVLVLPARGGPLIRSLDRADVWMVRDDGRGSIDAGLVAAGEAFDEVPGLPDCGLLVLASQPADWGDQAIALLERAQGSPSGLAGAEGHWPIAARREVLVEMAEEGFERVLDRRDLRLEGIPSSFRRPSPNKAGKA